MRYAIKTAPQMTTWENMLDVWREADTIETFESAWNFDHFEPILWLPRTGPGLERGARGVAVAPGWGPGGLSGAAGVGVGVGSRDEPDELSGVSHFLEHLLFKGTDSRSAQELARGVDRRGGDFNAFTSKESTGYYCRLPARHSDFCIELLGDVLTRPALRDDDVNGERQVILEELAMDDDSPDDVAHRRFAAALFEGHALGRDPAGDVALLEATKPDAVLSFFANLHRPAAIVGPPPRPCGGGSPPRLWAGATRWWPSPLCLPPSLLSCWLVSGPTRDCPPGSSTWCPASGRRLVTPWRAVRSLGRSTSRAERRPAGQLPPRRVAGAGARRRRAAKRARG